MTNNLRVRQYHGSTIEFQPEGSDETIEFGAGYGDIYQDSIKIVPTPKGFRIGFLVPDQDCPNPEENDGFGKIGTSNKRDSNEANKIFQDALGLTRDWERKVSAADLIDEIANDLDRDYYSLLRDRQANASRDNLKLPYRGAFDKLIERETKDGNMGDPDRVTLDVFEHSGRAYHVGYNPMFHALYMGMDAAYGGAVWVPDNELRKEVAGLDPAARKAKMIEFATQAVDEMNRWMAGDCWGIVIRDYDAEGELIEEVENCWGFIGSEYAEQEIAGYLKPEAIAKLEA